MSNFDRRRANLIRSDTTFRKRKHPKWRDRSTRIKWFYFFFLCVPSFIVTLYAIAILLPPETREKVPILVWTDGAFERIDGKAVLCPRETICSEGVFQIILVSIARITAFLSYVTMGLTYMSKMHCTIHQLSVSYLGTLIPFPHLHDVHKVTGKLYGILGLLHTITHFIRWIIRGDMNLLNTDLGISGMVATLSMLIVIVSMASWAKEGRFAHMITFEMRMQSHSIVHVLMSVALMFHTQRTRIITLIFTGLWFLDYFYGVVFKTYQIDLVEFLPLPNDSGTQMLWRNPRGFEANSGEYVKVQLPWLESGETQWHPFSLYLHEATEEGIEEVLRHRYDTAKSRVFALGGIGGREVNIETTAVFLISCQNEFEEGGKLYDDVKEVMTKNQTLKNLIDIVEKARSVGAQIFHIPIVLGNTSDNPNRNLGMLKETEDENSFAKGTWNVDIIDGHKPKIGDIVFGGNSDNPNRNVGMLQEAEDKNCFAKGTWNVEIIDGLKPKIGDIVISGKVGLDGFIATDLQSQLERRGIETVIIGGFLTNGSVESTMRTAYEKGFNVLTLTDGTACKSMLEQTTSTDYTFKMFSTPLTCAEASNVLTGNIPQRLVRQLSVHPFSSSSLDETKKEEMKSFVVRTDADLASFIHSQMQSGFISTRSSLIVEEARQNLRSQYDTSQIFIAPAGDWTNQVYKEVTKEHQLRSCWVRGPYISPYSIAREFSHLLLVASGIGITPALGVMGQYKGNSRTKILIWSTRCPQMLKFFVPLLSKDARMAFIYYTGKERLSGAEIKRLIDKGNIFIQQSRPESLLDVASTIITNTSANLSNLDAIPDSIKELSQDLRHHWCLFYCGGSKGICQMFDDYCDENNINFESELFDW